MLEPLLEPYLEEVSLVFRLHARDIRNVEGGGVVSEDGGTVTWDIPPLKMIRERDSIVLSAEFALGEPGPLYRTADLIVVAALTLGALALGAVLVVIARRDPHHFG
jgi:hypothetical protein